LSAPARLTAAPTDLWRRATDIRREWLSIGLCTEPADRRTAEQAITEIYARHHRPSPDFLWVDSPHQAWPHLTGLPTHETLRSWVADRRPPGRPPLASDIAAALSHLRSAAADTYTDPPRDRPPLKRKKGDPWPIWPPAEALAAGVPFAEILRQGIQDALFRSMSALYLPVRAALPTPVPVGWYGHQDIAWIALMDAQQRLGLASPGRDFTPWADLARATGWWFPGEHRCVMVERPEVLPVSLVPGVWHEEIRPAGPIVYRDGWTV
jgi:hypothetical protein